MPAPPNDHATFPHPWQAETPDAPLRFVWLEITGKCQLECSHCYAESNPRGTHGTMARGD